MPDQQGGSRAAAWLLAEFDATDPEDISDFYSFELDTWTRPVYVQPMIELKDDVVFDEYFSASMNIIQADYADPGAVWL